MSDAYITRRGGTGGVIENSKKQVVMPAENIAKNMFVEKTTAKILMEGAASYNILATFDGENFVAAYGKGIYLITKNEQGDYEQSDFIDLNTTNGINRVYLLSNELAIIGDLSTKGQSQIGAHYWYIVKIDFNSKLAVKTYTSEGYGGGNHYIDIQQNSLKVQVINSNTFLLMFTFSDKAYGYSTCCEFTLYTVNSSGTPTVKKQWVKKASKSIGFCKSSILGKFDEGEDSNGKYGLYWVQISYGSDEHSNITPTNNTLVNWVHLTLKIYYDTGDYEELYSNIGLSGTTPSSLPPGYYNNSMVKVIKNTLVYLDSAAAKVIKFNSNHIPNSNTPTNLEFTSGDKESGYGYKYIIDDGTNSLFLDALYFNCSQTINSKSHYITGRIVPTDDFVVFECLKYYGVKEEIENYGLLGSTMWSFYSKIQNRIVVNQNNRLFLGLSLEYFTVKLSSNSIFGVTNLKQLNDLEIDEISVLGN